MLKSTKSRQIVVISGAIVVAITCVWQPLVLLALIVIAAVAGGIVGVAFVQDWCARGDEDLAASRASQNTAKAREYSSDYR